MLGQDLPTLPTAKSKDQQYAFVWRLQRLLAFPSDQPTDVADDDAVNLHSDAAQCHPPPSSRTTASRRRRHFVAASLPYSFSRRLRLSPPACAKTIRERGRTEELQNAMRFRGRRTGNGGRQETEGAHSWAENTDAG